MLGLVGMIGLAFGGWAPAFGCTDYAADPKSLVALEPEASRGALSDDLKRCLETSYAHAPDQVTKGKISRVLLVNAYATDTSDWARLVKRHLDEVDQSDPDIAYLYSFYLYNHDPVANADAVVHWCDVGLERRQAWTGDVYIARVNGLMRLRSLASVREWSDLDARSLKDPSLAAAATEAKNRTKTFAREWLDFARSSGRDPTQAWSICVSAAPTPAACGEDPTIHPGGG